MDGTIGEIRHFAANFAPHNWAYCSGQIIAIQSNTALFSILGTTYGGNGTSNFQLPNFGGRIAIGAGQGPGLSFYDLGETAGTNGTTLLTSNLPTHTHTASAAITIPAYSDEGDTNTPNGNILAAKSNMYWNAVADTALKPAPFSVTVGIAGGSTPLSIMQPTIGMNYIICMRGNFPSRN